jgi:hypothetical protein
MSFKAIQLYFETWNACNKINLLIIKCKNAGFDIRLKNTFTSLHTVTCMPTATQRLDVPRRQILGKQPVAR